MHEGNETGSGEDYVNYACVCCWCDEPHSYTHVNIGGGYHSATCECGYSYSDIHTLIRKTPSYSVCMHCGYTVYHNGGIIEIPGIQSTDEESGM